MSQQATETTALLPNGSNDHTTDSSKTTSTTSAWFPPIGRVLFTSFIISISFAFTQTPLIYAFRVMTCDEYYKHHDPWIGTGDRCALPRIDADTASSVALVGGSTMFFTIINVFVTSWWTKKFGVKSAMYTQTAWAAARNLTQIYAQTIGGGTGIIIIQCTQIFNILGSAGGVQLAASSFIAELAEPERRTGLFGVQGGMQMLGAAVGYMFGGLAFKYFSYLAPFQIAFGLLCFSTLFGALFLPHIPPHETDSVNEKKKSGIFEPLKIFIPRKVDVGEGKMRTDWNLFLLAAGAFFSVFATGYVALALQLFGTNVFGFQPAESGFMLSWNLLMKAFFLSICFPKIISLGRKLTSHRTDIPTGAAEENPENPLQAEEPTVEGSQRQEQARQPTDKAHGSTFDLHFLQWSIFLDGILTACVAMSSTGWHLYLAATVIPFASGTGPAAKGVTLDFVRPEKRSDALGAIALVEKLAYISTIGVFGYAFSFLSELGQPKLVFVANAAVAMISFLLLIPVRMPRSSAQLA